MSVITKEESRSRNSTTNTLSKRLEAPNLISGDSDQNTFIKPRMELPSFSELMCLIEEGSIQTQDNHKFRDLTHTNFQNDYRTPRSCLGIDYDSNSRLKSFAHITSLKHFSLSDITRKKEEELFRYFISFFSTLDSLTNSLKTMKSRLIQVIKSEGEASKSSSDLYLVGIDNNGNQFCVLRNDFRKWVTDIPGIMYSSISEASYKMAQNLSELSSIKKSYNEEDSLNKLQEDIEMEKEQNKRNEWKKKSGDMLMASKKARKKEHRKYDGDNAITIDSKVTSGFHRYPFKATKNPIQKNSKRVKQKSHSSVCKHCGTTHTPEWRKGPDGSRTLCNACGLFYSKLLKKFGFNASSSILRQRKENKQVSDRTIPYTLNM